MKKLNSYLVTEPWQVELMRVIYNDNLDMLSTKPLPYRSYEEQQLWWEENNKNMKAYLYEPVSKPGKFVAFLVLRIRDGFFTPTIAIQKEDWGGGFGQEIVRDYIEKADGPLAGSQLQSNAAICHINKKVGWIIVGEESQSNGKVDLLYHPGVNPKRRCTYEVFMNILDYLEIDKVNIDLHKCNLIK
jgi:RimJ/RimL family protein N-acetyltransferase